MAQTVESQAASDLRGEALLNDPARNKGTAFTADERREFCAGLFVAYLGIYR
jgi:hypothetical protein